MELNEKLQRLRKQKEMTQEELAAALFVSRTAISKWESGRGYPSIDSLKAISGFFAVSIDDLLSTEEALNLAKEEHKQQEMHLRLRLFGLLDLASLLLLFLPLFGQREGESVRSVSLLMLTTAQTPIKLIYIIAVSAVAVCGALGLAAKDRLPFSRQREQLSLLLHALCVFLFILGRQPYAAVLTLTFLMIKALLLLKRP